MAEPKSPEEIARELAAGIFHAYAGTAGMVWQDEIAERIAAALREAAAEAFERAAEVVCDVTHGASKQSTEPTVAYPYHGNRIHRAGMSAADKLRALAAAVRREGGE